MVETSLMKYELNVEMPCGACSKAIEKIFSKCEDIQSTECDVPAQKVTVIGKDGLDLVAMLAKWVSTDTLMLSNCSNEIVYLSQ